MSSKYAIQAGVACITRPHSALEYPTPQIRGKIPTSPKLTQVRALRSITLVYHKSSANQQVTNAVVWCTTLCYTKLYCTELCGNILHYTALHSIALHWFPRHLQHATRHISRTTAARRSDSEVDTPYVAQMAVRSGGRRPLSQELTCYSDERPYVTRLDGLLLLGTNDTCLDTPRQRGD